MAKKKTKKKTQRKLVRVRAKQVTEAKPKPTNIEPKIKKVEYTETCPPMSEIMGIDPPPRLITPEMAIEWLENRAPNRTIDQTFVNTLKRDIDKRRWDVNGATIVFDSNGRLIDGQHRLWAIFDSGIPCYCHIVTGVDPEAIKNIDACRPRTSADQIQIFRLSEHNHKTIDGVARILLAEERAIEATGQFDFAEPGRFRPSNSEVIDAFNRHPRIKEIAGRTHMRPQLVSRVLLGYFFYKFSQVNRDKAESWLEALKTGQNLSPGSPIGKLRTRLIEDRLSRGEKLTRKAKAALVIKSWNLHVQDKSCTRLIWSANEQFPKIRKRA